MADACRRVSPDRLITDQAVTASSWRSVPLALREAAERDQADQRDDQADPEAPQNNQDDPDDPADPAERDAAVAAVSISHTHSLNPWAATRSRALQNHATPQ